MFKSPYNFDSDVSSALSSFSYDSDSDRTQQSFKTECDINTLVKTYARTGVVPGQGIGGFEFAVDEIVDYQTALNRLMEADASFMRLPSAVRDRFMNDPGRLLAFVHNPDNRDEAIELGLIAKKGDPEPLLVRLSEVSPPVNPPAAPPNDS